MGENKAVAAEVLKHPIIEPLGREKTIPIVEHGALVPTGPTTKGVLAVVSGVGITPVIEALRKSPCQRTPRDWERLERLGVFPKKSKGRISLGKTKNYKQKRTNNKLVPPNRVEFDVLDADNQEKTRIRYDLEILRAIGPEALQMLCILQTLAYKHGARESGEFTIHLNEICELKAIAKNSHNRRKQLEIIERIHAAKFEIGTFIITTDNYYQDSPIKHVARYGLTDEVKIELGEWYTLGWSSDPINSNKKLNRFAYIPDNLYRQNIREYPNIPVLANMIINAVNAGRGKNGQGKGEAPECILRSVKNLLITIGAIPEQCADKRDYVPKFAEQRRTRDVLGALARHLGGLIAAKILAKWEVSDNRNLRTLKADQLSDTTIYLYPTQKVRSPYNKKKIPERPQSWATVSRPRDFLELFCTHLDMSARQLSESLGVSHNAITKAKSKNRLSPKLNNALKSIHPEAYKAVLKIHNSVKAA